MWAYLLLFHDFNFLFCALKVLWPYPLLAKGLQLQLQTRVRREKLIWLYCYFLRRKMMQDFLFTTHFYLTDINVVAPNFKVFRSKTGHIYWWRAFWNTVWLEALVVGYRPGPRFKCLFRSGLWAVVVAVWWWLSAELLSGSESCQRGLALRVKWEKCTFGCLKLTRAA